MKFKDYYKILGLENSRVNIEQIKIAYRKQAKKYHPDVNVGNKLAEEKIKDINEAYKILSSPSSKRKYDKIWNANVGSSQRKKTGEFVGDFFNMFFGEVEERPKTEKKQMPIKGENIDTEINISIEDGFFGLEKKVSLKQLDGKSKTFDIKVPEGIKSGEKIRLIGQGKPGENGGRNGDLYIKINIEDGKKYKLDGCDIYTDLAITPWEAALGTKAKVISIDNTESKVYIPNGVQSGETIKIPGKGYKLENGNRGDLIAKVKIVVPQRLTKEEKEIYEKLKEISKFNPRNV